MFMYGNDQTVDQTIVEQSSPDDKSCGVDRLDGKFLKMLAIQLSQTICHIFNRCLISGKYPNLWKRI